MTARTLATPQRTFGARFWLIFIASTLSGIANSASTPIIPRFVDEQLGGDAAVAGFVASVSSFVSIVAQLGAGIAADRFGYKRISVVGAAVGAAGFIVVVMSVTMAGAVSSRALFGAGSAVLATAVMAWVVASVPRMDRGKALSIFGISVWIGLSLGPQIGETVFQALGFDAVWLTCCAFMVIALVALLPISDVSVTVDAAAAQLLHADAGSWRRVFLAVTRPGAVAALAWSAEGFMLTFLIVHLEHNGLRSNGITGAASVFTVLAASVIGARLVLGSLPERIGPTRTARFSIAAVAVGLVILTFAPNFAAAAAGAALMGAGFAPLYPALTMMATEQLDPSRRATGLGLFSAFTSVGFALGALVGGVIAAAFGETTAFLSIGAALVVAALIVRAPRDLALVQQGTTP